MKIERRNVKLYCRLVLLRKGVFLKRNVVVQRNSGIDGAVEQKVEQR